MAKQNYFLNPETNRQTRGTGRPMAVPAPLFGIMGASSPVKGSSAARSAPLTGLFRLEKNSKFLKIPISKNFSFLFCNIKLYFKSNHGRLIMAENFSASV